MQIEGCATQRCCPTPIRTHKLGVPISSRFTSHHSHQGPVPARLEASLLTRSPTRPTPKQGKPTHRAQQVPLTCVCLCGWVSEPGPPHCFPTIRGLLTSATRQGPERGKGLKNNMPLALREEEGAALFTHTSAYTPTSPRCCSS